MKTTDLKGDDMNDLLSEKDSAVLRDLLIEQLGVQPDQLTPEADLTRDLGADSLTKIEIAMAVDEAFGVTVPDEEMDRVNTVHDVYELTAQLLAQRPK
jgi:acyl carrier protein